MRYEIMNLTAEFSWLISNDCGTFMEMEMYNMRNRDVQNGMCT